MKSGRLEIGKAETGGPEGTRKAELLLGWTGLCEAFRNHWHGRGMTREEVQVYVGADALPFVRTGWLKCDQGGPRPDNPVLFWPAGELLAELTKDVEGGARGATRPTDEVHVSTFPIPHVVPTPTEMSAARALRSGASPSSTTAASAAAAVDFQRPPRTAVERELEEMIETLKGVSVEMQSACNALARDQAATGWPEWKAMEDGAAHLLRLSSDLHHALLQHQCGMHFTRPRNPKL